MPGFDVLPTRKISGYGWKPDLPDIRDLVWDVEDLTKDLPAEVDLRTSGHLAEPYDQGQLGSCTGNGIAAAVDFANHVENGKFVTPSRLFIYYGERVIENTVNEDSGAQIRDGIKVVAKTGVPPEAVWPYDIAKFKVKPSAEAFTEATADEAILYKRVPRKAIQAALASGYPVVFGFTVYDPFEGAEVAKSGVVPMPAAHDGVLGGHCVLAVGYKTMTGADGTQSLHIICRNSWGAGWGDGGYFYLPIGYFEKSSLSSDFWTITKTGGAA